MDCEKIREWLLAGRFQEVAAHQHLLGCPSCRDELAQLQRLAHAHSLGRPPVSTSWPRSILTALAVGALAVMVGSLASLGLLTAADTLDRSTPFDGSRAEPSAGACWSSADRNPKQALSQADAVLARDPGSTDARYCQGYVLLSLGRTEEGVGVLCDLLGANTPASREIGEILRQRGYECPVQTLLEN